MAYLKGGTVVDGDLTVEGELKVSSVTRNATLVGLDSSGNKVTEADGVPTEEVEYWKFSSN